MTKKRPRNEEPDEEEFELYTDGVDPKNVPDYLVLADEHERQVWAGFYSSIVCGAAAGSAGEIVNVALCAFEADEMLREYRQRRIEGEDIR